MGNRLYIGNLPASATADYLQNTFSVCGQVESVKIITDRDTGISKGFAFVEMSSHAEAQTVMSKFNGLACEGKAMKITEARPAQKRNFNNGRTKVGW